MIKKLERNTAKMGGGSGYEHFESDNFRVVWWGLSNWNQTVLECKHMEWPNDNIRFDDHIDFKSDEDCFNQLTCDEFLKIIESVKLESFERGKESKRKEIKKVLMGN